MTYPNFTPELKDGMKLVPSAAMTSVGSVMIPSLRKYLGVRIKLGA